MTTERPGIHREAGMIAIKRIALESGLTLPLVAIYQLNHDLRSGVTKLLILRSSSARGNSTRRPHVSQRNPISAPRRTIRQVSPPQACGLRNRTTSSSESWIGDVLLFISHHLCFNPPGQHFSQRTVFQGTPASRSHLLNPLKALLVAHVGFTQRRFSIDA